MWWLLGAVGVIVLAEAICISHIVRVLGGPASVFGGVRRPVRSRLLGEVGTPLRPFSCYPTGSDGRPRRQVVRAQPNCVIVHASPRSVSAHRVAKLLVELSGVATCPVKWVWAVGGERADVERFVRQATAGVVAVRLSQRRLQRLDAEGVPLAVHVDSQRIIRQVGVVRDLTSLVAFVESCEDSAFRAWLRRAAAGTAGRSVETLSVSG
jgi:hypothetical protein